MRLRPWDLMQKGGEWLGAARNWIQCKFVNGDRVCWGTQEALNGHLNVSDIEEFAARIAQVAIDEYRENPSRFVAGDIPTATCMDVGEELERVLSGMNTEGLQFVDRDGRRLGMHYHMDAEKGAVIVCRPLEDFSMTQRWK